MAQRERLHVVKKNEYSSQYESAFRKRVLAFMNEQENPEEFEILTAKERNERGNQMVTVINLMSKKEVQIRLADLGGACDPSTERHWSM